MVTQGIAPRCDAIRRDRKTTTLHTESCRKTIESAMQADASAESQKRLQDTVAHWKEYIKKRHVEDFKSESAKKS